MSHKDWIEKFRSVEEKVHLLAGVLATTSVLTLAVVHIRKQPLPEDAARILEIVDRFLVGIDVLIALMLAVGLVLRAVAIRKPNRLIRRLMKDKVISQHIQKWLTQSNADLTASHVRFCTDDCVEQLIALNYAAFRDTEFDVELEKLADRNREWVRKNKQIFMLVLDPLAEAETVIGYSSMLPLTADGIKSYLNGALKDADIPPPLIAADIEETAAVLVFAIHLRPEYSINETTTSRNYSLFFLERVRYHVRQMFSGINGRNFPPLYVQTELRSLGVRLDAYGFTPTGKRSADGFDILVLKRPFQVMEAESELVINR